jgi:CubicO group peptidase (beta-lactamase class C family)
MKSLPSGVLPFFALACSFIAAAYAQQNRLQIARQRKPTTERLVALADASLKARVDKLFMQWDKPDSPGCALAIVRDGQFTYSRGYGMADLEHDVPIITTSG